VGDAVGSGVGSAVEVAKVTVRYPVEVAAALNVTVLTPTVSAVDVLLAVAAELKVTVLSDALTSVTIVPLAMPEPDTVPPTEIFATSADDTEVTMVLPEVRVPVMVTDDEETDETVVEDAIPEVAETVTVPESCLIIEASTVEDTVTENEPDVAETVVTTPTIDLAVG
jgi:hypothetical protein